MHLTEDMLERTGDRLSLEDISVFEKKHGIALHRDYKDFLLKFNGGRARDGGFYIYFIIKDSTSPDGFKGGYDVDFHKLQDLTLRYPSYATDDDDEIEAAKQKSKLYLEIGEGLSAIHMIGIGSENFGQIFVHINHGDEDYNPHKVAENFSEFIEKIIFVPEEDV